VRACVRTLAPQIRVSTTEIPEEPLGVSRFDYNRAMLPFLLQGLTLGFAAGAQPGPFQTYLISQTLSQGWRRAWIAAFGPLVSDGPIVALVLLVLSQVPNWFQRVLQIAGGLFVLYLAWGAYKAWQSFAPDMKIPSRTGPRNLLRAALMNALSPGPYLFWSLVIGPLIVTAWRENSANALSIVLGFYFAMVALNMSVVLLFGQAARFGNQVRKVMLGLSVLALAGFGVYQLWQGIFPWIYHL
jgi:threonine/homoserine/homoserine lactone efflux protein